MVVLLLVLLLPVMALAAVLAAREALAAQVLARHLRQDMAVQRKARQTLPVGVGGHIPALPAAPTPRVQPSAHE